jgi:hypothetical protein
VTVLDRSSDAPAYPGPGAPLNLPNLTAEESSSILTRFLDGTFADWADAAAAVKSCVHPIRLTGSSETFDKATGEPLRSFSSADAPLGVLYLPCRNRRADVCPSCSRLYARDTFELIRAGVLGGKTVPESVADNPLLFVTLTAPGFGHVHRAGKNGKRCRPRDRVEVCAHGRPLGCMNRHADGDPVVGSPLCWDCYDWDSAAVWNWWAPELWRRTTIQLRRELASALGVKESRLRKVASLQYAKVAEYQARGSVHFHALIRLDGSDGPGSTSPLSAKELGACVEAAVRHVTYRAYAIDAADRVRHLAWGDQLDIKTIRDHARTDDPTGTLSAEQVAGYVAKYASKDAVSKHNPQTAPAHLRRLMKTCLDLDQRHRLHHGEQIHDAPYGLLAKWAPSLGFRGHFSTKSRRYSVTLGALRRARGRFAALLAESRSTGKPIDTRDLEARLLAEDAAETTLVVGSWTFQGSGWPEPGDAALAASAAARAREYDQWRAQERRAA